MIKDAINLRYSKLSESNCCLSCGGAVNYAAPVKGEVCVDLGSGRGNDVIRLAEEVGSEGYVYGIDISEGMVLKAKANIEKFSVQNAAIIQAELENIPLEDNFVDLVISNCTINHSSNKQKVWNEVFRILKAGGRFVVSDIYAVKKISAKYRNDPQAVAECWAGADTKDVYFKMLDIAGFKNIRIFEESAPYAKGKSVVSSFTITGIKIP
jgi:ubiquinone/menaquinone biosynthesis C-methylase UbiE